MLKILIIDDEAPARNRLHRMLVKMPAVQVAAEAATASEALEFIESLAPDVLLLDISMPGMDGMALARLLKQQDAPPAVIFCTAWSDQAVEAFECDAVDYLVKPVRAERLEAALDKARRFITAPDEQAQEHFLRSTLGTKVSLLPLAEAICLNAEDKYITVIHENGNLVINQSLLDLENEYADVLVRVHRGTLVAKKRIRGLEKANDGRHYLLLDGCDERPQVSRRNLPAIRKLIRELT
ncbi:MAG: response regulator transcription factor [Xanthomonadales bacterium]|nr:LytTR family DNA-binding domain-containing protein [Gammaproteobacteria bacterium]MBT8072113.1 LytTR family DNA-binding domain-containing protein [Gammaproteobacteria bacterium]NNK02953.1 response regulator transcription factor [Xanthomonadales bacterium]NNK98332.1 response regulator transcription factor [Xanthomonadales bacterium]